MIQPSFMRFVPISILPVKIKLSPSIILPNPLKGSVESNHFIILFGEIVLVESLCSAKYLTLPILG